MVSGKLSGNRQPDPERPRHQSHHRAYIRRWPAVGIDEVRHEAREGIRRRGRKRFVRGRIPEWPIRHRDRQAKHQRHRRFERCRAWPELVPFHRIGRRGEPAPVRVVRGQDVMEGADDRGIRRVGVATIREHRLLRLQPDARPAWGGGISPSPLAARAVRRYQWGLAA